MSRRCFCTSAAPKSPSLLAAPRSSPLSTPRQPPPSLQSQQTYHQLHPSQQQQQRRPLPPPPPQQSLPRSTSQVIQQLEHDLNQSITYYFILLKKLNIQLKKSNEENFHLKQKLHIEQIFRKSQNQKLAEKQQQIDYQKVIIADQNKMIQNYIRLINFNKSVSY